MTEEESTTLLTEKNAEIEQLKIDSENMSDVVFELTLALSNRVTALETELKELKLSKQKDVGTSQSL